MAKGAQLQVKSGEAAHLADGFRDAHRELMCLVQGSMCAICGTKLSLNVKPGSKMRAMSDHCHVTGAPRGLLCGVCNTAEGHLRKNGDLSKMPTGRSTQGVQASAGDRFAAKAMTEKAASIRTWYWPAHAQYAEGVQALVNIGLDKRSRRLLTAWLVTGLALRGGYLKSASGVTLPMTAGHYRLCNGKVSKIDEEALAAAVLEFVWPASEGRSTAS